jgi:hypothetical protein
MVRQITVAPESIVHFHRIEKVCPGKSTAMGRSEAVKQISASKGRADLCLLRDGDCLFEWKVR